MKKTIIIISLLLAMSHLTSCLTMLGSLTNSDTTTSKIEISTKSETESAELTKSEETTEIGEVTDDLTFSELIAVDNAECSIKITGIDPNNMWGYTVKVQLENKTTDKTLMFSVSDASVNGVKSDPLFASEVAPDKKSNNDISFAKTVFKENGIDFTDIEMTFRVYDSNNWFDDDIANETIHVYPYGADKATKFIREPKPSDNVIIDNDYVSVIVTGYDKDDTWGYTVNLFLLNKSDKNIMFSVDEASINGYMIDPFFATSVCAGKCYFTSMSWSDTALSDNGITTVEEIEFKLSAHDDDKLGGDDFVNEVIKLKP